MHASFASSRAMSVNPSIKQQYPLHNLAIPSGVCSVNGITTCTWPPVHYSAQSRLNAHAHSISTATVTPQSSHEEEFFLKDALRDFFAEGQSKDLTPFCQRIGKRRAKMSREINKHHFLKGIWNQRKKGMGFTKDQSVAASNYIDKLPLPSKLQSQESSKSPSATAKDSLDRAIATAKTIVKEGMDTHLSIEGHQTVGDTNDILMDKDFPTAMKMLRAANVYCVPCDNGFSAISCETPSCNEIMIVRTRRDNQLSCKSCTGKKHHGLIAASRNEQNRAKRTAADRKTPFSKLTPSEQKERSQNRRNKKNSDRKRLKVSQQEPLSDTKNIEESVSKKRKKTKDQVEIGGEEKQAKKPRSNHTE